MADNAAIYSSLKDNQEAIWGARARTIDYQYNANGAMTRKLTYTTNEQYPETNFIEKEVYSYNLQGRLKQVEFTDASGTTTTVYTYNADGIRIKKDVDSGDEVTTYLIDPMNHTGYAQVIEETITLSNDDVTYISYVIGDDVIAQAKAMYDDSADTWTYQGPHYLLYDGHGSTRQLADENENIDEVYAYDAYGVNLDASSSPTTSLQYAGEHYDADAQHYYNRARWYNPSNGRFNRVDPFAGNNADPQSLHKYLYAHANPINGIDPSGMATLIGNMIAVLSGMFNNLVRLGLSMTVKTAVIRSVLGFAIAKSMQFYAEHYVPQTLDSLRQLEWATSQSPNPRIRDFSSIINSTISNTANWYVRFNRGLVTKPLTSQLGPIITWGLFFGNVTDIIGLISDHYYLIKEIADVAINDISVSYTDNLLVFGLEFGMDLGVLSASVYDMNCHGCYHRRRYQNSQMRTTDEESNTIEITGKTCPWA